MKSLIAINYFKKAFYNNKVQIQEIDLQSVDANRAYVLYLCSMVNKSLYAGNGQLAFDYAQIAFYDTYQMIEPADNHFGQVL
mmetsp:Transcript_42815/g.41157  ORF Transcript_42815/g.41157 Transcript_42815/m.41157 type:complete len:82 (+) Transcript_42815:2484-2729(+)